MSNVSSASFWEKIYRRGQVGWDLGRPTPVFRRLLREGVCNPGKMIVLGAGRGFDARMFARNGFEVSAVDFAAEAAQAMRELSDPDAPVEILEMDIFDLSGDLEGVFDYVLEYTCYCAIDPQRGGEYADVVSGLLAPGGHYIALVFPISSYSGGPPFAVSPDELLGLFLERGFEMVQRENPLDSVPQRRKVEELLILRKPA